MLLSYLMNESHKMWLLLPFDSIGRKLILSNHVSFSVKLQSELRSPKPVSVAINRKSNSDCQTHHGDKLIRFIYSYEEGRIYCFRKKWVVRTFWMGRRVQYVCSFGTLMTFVENLWTVAFILKRKSLCGSHASITEGPSLWGYYCSNATYNNYYSKNINIYLQHTVFLLQNVWEKWWKMAASACHTSAQGNQI